MKPQTKAVLDHLLTGRSITPLDALRLYGCFRLGARILELKKEYLDIQTTLVNDHGKRYASYSLRHPSMGTAHA